MIEKNRLTLSYNYIVIHERRTKDPLKPFLSHYVRIIKALTKKVNSTNSTPKNISPKKIRLEWLMIFEDIRSGTNEMIEEVVNKYKKENEKKIKTLDIILR